MFAQARGLSGSHSRHEKGRPGNPDRGCDLIPFESRIILPVREAGHQGLGRDLPAGQVASINLDEVSEQVDGQVLGAYLELQQESPEGERPEPLEVPDTDTGPHLAYAIQWWLVIPALWVFVVVALLVRYFAGAAVWRVLVVATLFVAAGLYVVFALRAGRAQPG